MLALAVALAAAFLVFGARQLTSAASSNYAANSTGFDISWPQCGGPYPATPYGFGIVGVTGGKAFTENRCFASEWHWAASANAADPSVYFNVNGVPKNYRFRACAGDAYCTAYFYGYNTAAAAVRYARAQGAQPQTWWLDVETMNSWSKDKLLNARVIAGAIDYLQAMDKTAGIYSTPYQWGEIAGYYVPGLPNWSAGADDLEDAKTRCDDPRYAFGGGRVQLVQWVETYDMNYACP
ncbi:MAG: hypothetical protein ACR2HN_11150 [Tepidiformaceae bacterium]